MEIHISKELELEIKKIALALKFRTTEEFIKKAIREKILEIKKKRFFEISERIRVNLEKQGIAEEEILSDFEEKR